MDDEIVTFETGEENDASPDTVERTRNAVRVIGRIIIGALAAVLAAEALTFRKK